MRERDDAIPDLAPGDRRSITREGHRFEISVATVEIRSYRVECATCGEVVHLATAYPMVWVLFHVDHSGERIGQCSRCGSPESPTCCASPPSPEREVTAAGSTARAEPSPADPPEITGEQAYLALIRRILAHGERREDRTGTGTLSVFGAQMRFDLRDGFPLLTTKRVPFAPIVRELLWFLRGDTNVRDGLSEHTKIWDAWAREDGDLGPIYGHQFRRWGGHHVPGPAGSEGSSPLCMSDGDLIRVLCEVDGMLIAAGSTKEVEALSLVRWALDELRDRRRGADQISEALSTIKTNPSSRRIVVSAWSVSDLPRMRLPPCHLLFQFYVGQGGFLDCQLYQRSGDMALGVPFNIASYALLLSMFARECGLTSRHLVHTLGDAHVYLNHVDGVREQIARAPMPPPRLVLADKPVLEQAFEDVSLEGYVSHPAIRFEVSV